MHAAQALAQKPRTEQPARTQWLAALQLEYLRAAASQRTYLARNTHVGPLVVQKALYPEGEAVCHTLILHPPAGIAANDHLQIAIRQHAGTHALVTTPGAAKWYRSANGANATQDIEIDLHRGAMLEWFPQESIVFRGARACMRTKVRLEDDARFLGWDITCLGRAAAGERFDTGRLHQVTEISLDDAPIWTERCILDGGSPLLSSALGLNGNHVTGIMIAAGKHIPARLLGECRALEVGESGRTAVTAMPRVLVARYLGSSAEEARRFFIAVWSVLRPYIANRAALPPRIWST